jgi:hypothetical protein
MVIFGKRLISSLPILLLSPGPLFYFTQMIVSFLSDKEDQTMTVAEKARSTAPRSALRYRPISTGLESPSQAVTRARKSRTDARVTTAPAVPDDLDHEHHPASRPRRAPSIQRTRPNRYVSPWWFISAGFLVTLLLWVGATQLIAWGTNQYNAIVYGTPRTFQIDAVVGQGDSAQHPSHFESINLHGLITILEFPAGDPSRLRELTALSVPGPNADQSVAFLRFINLDHTGHPDLVITIDGAESVLINDGKTFRQPTPTEQQQMLQALQRENH